jgi:histidinol phosphatase-like enzyme (inositol monophosphatase family)
VDHQVDQNPAVTPDTALAEALMATAHALADLARPQTLAHFRTAVFAENKLASGFDPVTVADRAAEAAMRAHLATARPDDAILGEEYGPKAGTTGLTWVLDPIDGTRGYISGTPTWGVLISVANADGPLFGIIDQPFIGERFFGGFGHAGTTGPMGARPLKTRAPRPLAEAQILSTFPEVGTEAERRGFHDVAGRARLTRYGMDCYGYALLAAGQVDLVIEAGLQAYDVQAPIAVIHAAGGIVTDWHGGPAHDGGRTLAAANPQIHAEALAILRRHVRRMSDLLIKGADVVLTMDDARTEPTGVDIHIADGVIQAIGPGLTAPGAEVILATGCVVTPGLVNTHHHLYQTLTRAVPGGQDALLFGWLRTLYPIWQRFGPEEIFTSAQIGLAELALSGCSLTSDHLYLFPNGARLDDTIAAAAEVGLRFHPTRGAMSIGESSGGLPPDSLVETEPAILEDCIRVVDSFHNPNPGAMVRVGIAPCSPFSVSRELMRDAALLARDKGVMLHTHLAENDEDVAYSLAHLRLSARPIRRRPRLDRP